MSGSAGSERIGVLREKIERANQLLKSAEEELERAVASLVPVLVGDKRVSTTALEVSFEKLRQARRVVGELEGSLATELASPA